VNASSRKWREILSWMKPIRPFAAASSCLTSPAVRWAIPLLELSMGELLDLGPSLQGELANFWHFDDGCEKVVGNNLPS
jgi:hypothetical protein